MGAGGHEDEIERLYAAPLDAFVKTRDAIVAELKKAGDKAGAAAMKARPRPSVSAWAVNRLWRVANDEFEALLAAGDGLREAQRHALSGGGGDRMKRALAERRTAVTKLLARAKDELEAGGHAASAATLHRVESTLHTVATIGERAGLGQMAGDVGDEGEDGLAGLLAAGASSVEAPVRPPKEPEKKPAPKAHEPRTEKAARVDPALKKAKDRADAAKAGYAAASERQKKADHAVREGEKAKASGREVVDAAKADLKAAEEALRDARLAVDAAEKSARVTDREADVAARALTEADRALDRARVERDAAVAALDAAK